MQYKRAIKPCNARVTPITLPADSDIKDWLAAQATSHNFKWLLAHADDGVIWGRVGGETLELSGEVSDISPLLRSKTLQTARLFGANAELLLWRDGDNAWQARLIDDSVNVENATWQEVIDEQHILWGTTPKQLDNNFTLMHDGVEGLAHAVPILVTGHYDIYNRPLRLHVRHYLHADETGFIRIHTSRLVDLTLETQS